MKILYWVIVYNQTETVLYSCLTEKESTKIAGSILMVLGIPLAV